MMSSGRLPLDSSYRKLIEQRRLRDTARTSIQPSEAWVKLNTNWIRGARRKNRWLAEKSVVLEHAQAISADNLREPVSKMSEHFVKGSIEKQGLFWIFAQMELLPVVENED